MLTVSAKSKSSVPILEADTYPARCVSLIDIGDQFSEMSGRFNRQVVLMFELPTEHVVIDGEKKPRFMSITYTLSLSEKAKLRTILETWRGRGFTDDELKGFDLKQIVGQACMLTVVHKTAKNGNTYANIGTITKPMKGITIPEAETPLLIYDLDEPDALEKMEQLPEWVQNRIKQSETYKRMTEQASTAQGFMDVNPDDLPF